jgi:hypothetical protein
MFLLLFFRPHCVRFSRASSMDSLLSRILIFFDNHRKKCCNVDLTPLIRIERSVFRDGAAREESSRFGRSALIVSNGKDGASLMDIQSDSDRKNKVKKETANSAPKERREEVDEVDLAAGKKKKKGDPPDDVRNEGERLFSYEMFHW